MQRNGVSVTTTLCRKKMKRVMHGLKIYDFKNNKPKENVQYASGYPLTPFCEVCVKLQNHQTDKLEAIVSSKIQDV